MNRSLFPEYPILLVDDETHYLNSLEFNLNAKGLGHVECCADSRQVMPLLKEKKFSLILLDILMPHISGMELLPKIIGNYPGTPVILLTAVSETETVVDCMKAGAFDYLVKPVEPEELTKKIRQALNFLKARKEDNRLQDCLFAKTPKNPGVFSGIITKNKRMINIFKYIELIAESMMPALITGEPGCGKELIAPAVHKLSRQKGEYVTISVGGMNDKEFSDTLFDDKNGLLQKAEDGTLFLDEIADIQIPSQVKLLRLLQEGEYYPRHSNKLHKANIRFITATGQNLPALVKEGKFRNDLYHRMKVHHIEIPPLRKRKEDIPLLVEHFLEKAEKVLNKPKPQVPKELYKLLSNYDFPGNIRELAVMVGEALARHESGPLSLDVFQEKIKEKGVEIDIPTAMTDPGIREKKITFGDPLPTFKEVEEMYIKETLKKVNGKKTTAARIAGLSNKDFANRLRRLTKS
jgi:DNA-binding NtrC family response regulator